MKFSIKQPTKNDEEKPIDWIKWSSELEQEEGFTFEVESIRFKEEPNPVFYLINETEGKGTSVFCTNHPDSKFESTPHGIRLVNAIGRAAGIEGEVEVDQILTALELPFTVNVQKTDKGVLWSIV